MSLSTLARSSTTTTRERSTVHALPSGAIGRRSLNSAPPVDWFSASTSPPCARAMAREIASPSPVPPALVVKNGSKSRERIPSALRGLARRGDADPPSPRRPRRLGGVLEQVEQHLANLGRVGQRPGGSVQGQ